MKYAGLKLNDIVDGYGVCVSFWTQGCPYHCKNCHNPDTWDFEGGMDLPLDIKKQIIEALSAQNIKRNFSVLGGEPLCPENRELVSDIISCVREYYPNIKIYLWTGSTYESLIKENNIYINTILNNIDVLIDGPYIDELRDIRLSLRGSSNQRVINIKETLDKGEIILYNDSNNQ